MTQLLAPAAFVSLLIANTSGAAAREPHAPAAAIVARAAEIARGRSVHVSSHGLSPPQDAALRKAFARAGLSLANEAEVTVDVSRLDERAVLVSVSAPPDALWTGAVHWPAPSVPLAPEPHVARADDTMAAKVARYQRERLWLRAAGEMYLPALSLATPMAHQNGYESANTGSAVAPMRTDWTAMRGTSQELSDAELARLAGDLDVAQRVEGTLRQRRWLWLGAFVGGGAALGGTGAYLLTRDQRDLRNVGISLAVVGGVAAVVGAFSPWLTPEHVLTPTQAQALMAMHNERLLVELGLEPQDVN